MNIELLLQQVSSISKKFDSIHQMTGGYFNIFSITNVESDEVTLCRVIYELINPKGSHYQGDCYFKLFLEYVLKIDESEIDFHSLEVIREYVIDHDRRIDLVIKDSSHYIPIEVKIYAEDQDHQCFDYLKKAKKSDLYYLTLDGRKPSPKSVGFHSDIEETIESNSYKGIQLISFKSEILIWVQNCLKLYDTVKIGPIREVLLQFEAVIRKLTNQMDEDKLMEIVNVLSRSSDSMRAALDIEKGVLDCKKTMMEKVLRALENNIDRTKISITHDYEQNRNLIDSYYDRKGSTFPSINYFCKSLNSKGVELWFRIEIDWHIFAGFCTPLNGYEKGRQAHDEDLIGVLSQYNLDKNSWWVYWEYLPNNIETHSPNFKNFNEAYLDLFDEAKFDKFIDDTAKQLNRMLEMVT